MAIEDDNLLIQVKEDLYYRILSDPYLINNPVVLDDEHDPDQRDLVDLGTENFRNGKTGSVVVVMASGIIGISSANTPTPLMDLVVLIDVVEDVLVNAGSDGSGKNAAMIVARLVQLLHNMHFDERFTGFRLSDKEPISELRTDIKGERGFQVRFEASDVSFLRVPDVASVVISEDAGEITLTCDTAGATIFYTTDGSYPAEENPEATEYSVPFSPGSGVTVRAAAIKADMNPSKMVRGFLTT